MKCSRARHRTRPLIWRSAAAAAAVLAELNRESEADEKRRSAQAMIEEIASLFEDPALSQRFLDNAQRQILQEAVQDGASASGQQYHHEIDI